MIILIPKIQICLRHRVVNLMINERTLMFMNTGDVFWSVGGGGGVEPLRIPTKKNGI